MLARIIEIPASLPADDRKRLIESLVRAANEQNRMKAEDLRSNDEPHQRLYAEFKRMSVPWFYDHKPGIWLAEKKSRLRYRNADKTYRRVGMKDLAQSGLAFFGRPRDAIEEAGHLIEASEHDTLLFPRDVPAISILLPHLVLLEAAAVARSMKIAKPPRPMSGYADYLRYPAASCVGRLLHKLVDVDLEQYFPMRVSRDLAASIELWAPELLMQAFVKLEAAVEAREGRTEVPANAAAAPAAGVQRVGPRALVRQEHFVDEPYGAFRDWALAEIRANQNAARAVGLVKPLGLAGAIPHIKAL